MIGDSGIPLVRNLTATTAGVGVLGYRLTPAVSSRILLQNEGLNVIRVYFSAADYTTDTNYVAVAAGGGMDLPAQVDALWWRSVVGDSAFTFVAILRARL